MKAKRAWAVAATVVVIGLLTCICGCESSKQRVARVAEERDWYSRFSLPQLTPQQALLFGIMNNDIEEVQIDICRGADVDIRDEKGWTPLHWAASCGVKNIAELFIKDGADVNAANNWGVTPLHCAARKGYKSILKLLLEKGADINARDKHGRTPLAYALYPKRGNMDIVTFLQGHGGTE